MENQERKTKSVRVVSECEQMREEERKNEDSS